MLAKEWKHRTYHSFFQWSSKNNWMPEQLGQTFIPRTRPAHCPANSWHLTWLASQLECTGYLLWWSRPGATNCRHPAAQLAPGKNRLLWIGQGWLQGKRWWVESIEKVHHPPVWQGPMQVNMQGSAEMPRLSLFEVTSSWQTDRRFVTGQRLLLYNPKESWTKNIMGPILGTHHEVNLILDVQGHLAGLACLQLFHICGLSKTRLDL